MDTQLGVEITLHRWLFNWNIKRINGRVMVSIYERSLTDVAVWNLDYWILISRAAQPTDRQSPNVQFGDDGHIWKPQSA